MRSLLVTTACRLPVRIKAMRIRTHYRLAPLLLPSCSRAGCRGAAGDHDVLAGHRQPPEAQPHGRLSAAGYGAMREGENSLALGELQALLAPPARRGQTGRHEEAQGDEGHGRSVWE